MLLRSWRFVAPLVLTMPEPVLLQIIHAVTWWIERASTQEHNDKSIIAICRRILVLPMEVDAGSRTIRNGIEVDDPLGSAINHPVGHITQALLNQWFKQQLNDNDGLPADLAPIFTELCDTTVAVFRHGRIVLCSRLITFSVWIKNGRLKSCCLCLIGRIKLMPMHIGRVFSGHPVFTFLY